MQYSFPVPMARLGKVHAILMRSGFMLVAVSALLFACKGTLIKYLYAQGASPDDVMLLRMVFSLPVYGWVACRLLLRERRGLQVSHILGASAVGVSGYYLASYLDLLGLQFVSAGLERVILYTYPVFVVLLSAGLLGRKVSLSMLVCIAVTYVGLLLVFYADIHVRPAMSLVATTKGTVYVLLSAIAFSVYVIGSEYYMRIFSSALFTALAMLAAAWAVLLHYSVFNAFSHLLNLSKAVYAGCGITALFFTVLPSFMMSAGVRMIGSAKAGAIGMIGPVATVLIAGTVLGEHVSVMQFVGLLVVMLGVQRLHKL